MWLGLIHFLVPEMEKLVEEKGDWIHFLIPLSCLINMENITISK